jgi:hypothetical protein
MAMIEIWGLFLHFGKIYGYGEYYKIHLILAVFISHIAFWLHTSRTMYSTLAIIFEFR